MKTKLFALVLLTEGFLFAESHWSIGIGTPYYAPASPSVTYAPPCPGREYEQEFGAPVPF